MRKWMNFETRFSSLSNGLRSFLKESSIKYELSGTIGFYHYEIYCSEEEAEAINDWLDANTITEVRA